MPPFLSQQLTTLKFKFKDSIMWSCAARHIKAAYKVSTQSLYSKSLLKVSTQSLANVGAPRVSYLLTQTFEFPFAAAYFRVAKFRTLKNSLPPFYTSPRLLVPPPIV